MDITQLTEILTTEFDLDIDTCRFLPGEADVNAFVATTDGSRFVCKLHAPDRSTDDLDLQDATLERLATDRPELGAPRLVSRRTMDIDGTDRVVRLLSWVDGVALTDADQSADLRRPISRSEAINRPGRGAHRSCHQQRRSPITRPSLQMEHAAMQ